MSSRWSFAAALSIFVASVWGQIDNNAAPVVLPFSNDTTVGPDGPWQILLQAVDYPDQFMTLLPSLANNTLIINSSACGSQTAACPLPVPTLWQLSGADIVAENNKTISTPGAADGWDSNYAALLRMNGTGSFFSERLVLHPDGDLTNSLILSYWVTAISDGYEATYPGGAGYTLDTGFFSLYAGEPTFAWPDMNGFVWHNNRTLSDAYISGYIPSTSYGLHVGSVAGGVAGSLVLGGYDSSRCIAEPLISDSNTVTLTGISLNVSSGATAFTNASTVPIENLLRQNGSVSSALTVTPDPGVPYMYLPRDTCDAIAAHLPVTWNEDYHLYFWNTDNDNWKNIVSSPHYISFTFSGSGSSTTTINVPFALMNMTLTSPLVNENTPYFPCSPWDGNGIGHFLGRAFLQGAFLAQNWNTSTLFLAQAPGPNGLPQSVKTIAVTDTTLTPAVNPGTWEDSWSSLKALSSNSSSNTTSGSSPSSSTSKSSSLSGGAIAGIVVGAIILVALLAGLAWFIRKRKSSSRSATTTHHSSAQQEEMQPFYGSAAKAAPPPHYHDEPPLHQQYGPHGEVYGMQQQQQEKRADSPPPVEAPANPHAYELSGVGSAPAQELPGSEVQR